ncbi:undecaprenyl-phosphate glucose phosphotransferase [Methylocaldum sp.]|uniref:undecaprenyl-phosphate glucose phosphotransferase n=1 Tax=Methylocaldum sp. TaxID=1969727 RepID=UPI002D3586ED|nr:undecaprenyl-phosphate glucose phosphotransferase [Methylocaldum sp.]HYE35702.1 undecaprenyl-phosphate glucose phosphotransferase [Methylocaldum sp.]
MTTVRQQSSSAQAAEYIYNKPKLAERSRSNGLIRPYYSKVPALERLIDGFSICAMLWLIVELRGIPWYNHYTWFMLGAVLFYNFFAEVYEVYDWRGEPMYKEVARISITCFSAASALIILVFITKRSDDFSRLVVGAWILSCTSVLIISHQTFRLIMRYVANTGQRARDVAILGGNELGQQLVNTLVNMPWLGYRGYWFYDDRSNHEDRRLSDNDIKLAGNFETLYKHASNGNISTLYITLPLCAQKRVETIIDRLADTTVSVYFVPDFFVFNLLHSRWASMQGIPAVSIYETPFHQLNGFCKRLEDIIFSIVILLICFIPMVLIALSIKLTSPGPVLFKQKRYGIHGQTIGVWKFRTMHICEDGENIVQATRNDPRVTRVGKFLRSTSLDELPQFFNVLQGTMSIVGPRPHAVAHNELYRKLVRGYMLRHKVKPGITGLAQINGCRGEIKNENMMEMRIHYDLEYIRDWSLMLDFKIIILTIIRGMFSEQAY